MRGPGRPAQARWARIQARRWRRDLLVDLPPSTASSEIPGALYAQCRIDGPAPQDYHRPCPAQIALRVEGGLHATSLTARSAPYGRPLVGAPAFAQPPVTTSHTVNACHRDRRRHPSLHREPERAQDQIMLTDNAVEHITDSGDAASTRPTPRWACLWPCQSTRACQASRASSPSGIASTPPTRSSTAPPRYGARHRVGRLRLQLPPHRALQHHADRRGVLCTTATTRTPRHPAPGVAGHSLPARAGVHSPARPGSPSPVGGDKA
jgi:hypothetical protein